MNVVKILPITDLATECHNPMLEEYRKVCLKGKVINIKVPCNIVIFVTDKCPYNCSWCINKENKVNEYKNELCEEQYLLAVFDLLAELEKANKAINNDNFEITITGGEPTIDLIRFTSILKAIYMYKIPIRTVSTTGHYLFETFNNVPLYQHMISHGAVNNVNISRHAIDPKENSEIFGVKKEPLSIEDLGKISDVFRLNGGELRVSCNIAPHEKFGIHDNFMDIVDYIHCLYKEGVNSFIFREIAGSKRSRDCMDKLVKYITENCQKLEGMYLGNGEIISIYKMIDVTIGEEFLIKVYNTIEDICLDGWHGSTLAYFRDILGFTLPVYCNKEVIEDPVYDLLVFRNGKLYAGFNPTKSNILIDFTDDEVRR